jgi:hypothetical protein
MTTAKKRITELVKEYIRLFPAEYEAFKSANAAKVDTLGIDNDFAELKGSEQLVRHLFDLPETLHHALQRGLNDQEYDWLYSRGEFEKNRKGLQWFITAFPVFKITKDY